jgi:hypothetical protein
MEHATYTDTVSMCGGYDSEASDLKMLFVKAKLRPSFTTEVLQGTHSEFTSQNLFYVKGKFDRRAHWELNQAQREAAFRQAFFLLVCWSPGLQGP